MSYIQQLEDVAAEVGDRLPNVELALNLGDANQVFIGLRILNHPIEQAAILTGYANSRHKTRDGIIKILKFMVQLQDELEIETEVDAPIFECFRDDCSVEKYWLTHIKSDDDIMTIVDYFVEHGHREVLFASDSVPVRRKSLLEEYIY